MELFYKIILLLFVATYTYLFFIALRRKNTINKLKKQIEDHRDMLIKHLFKNNKPEN
jgi:hypothetical protein